MTAQAIAVKEEPVTLMEVIRQAAADPNADVTKLEKLVAMAERAEARQGEQLFNASMTDVQGEIRPIAADASNPQTKSKYASYLALDRVLRPIYVKHGFSLSFDTGEGAPADYVRVLCYVGHRDGHSRTYHVDMPADGKGAKGGDVMTKTHASGSAMSYGQRYLLKLIFNIAVGDDDGNAAGGLVKIDADQAETIRDLIERSKSSAELFCQYFKIDAVPDLPAKEFSRAVEMLNTKERKAK